MTTGSGEDFSGGVELFTDVCESAYDGFVAGAGGATGRGGAGNIGGICGTVVLTESSAGFEAAGRAGSATTAGAVVESAGG
jgi:hypothetical protein